MTTFPECPARWLKYGNPKNRVISGHRPFSPLTLLQHVEFPPVHTFFPTCSIFGSILHWLLERLAKEKTFFVLLGEQGNKAILDWVMKEGLIPFRYECSKCKKDMRFTPRRAHTLGANYFGWR
ncbi:hypothetical protein TNCV_3920821 [Trichonephila clavipes]|nr:hypothetical protein TNCV_3920821 [Trichonephila clavipes]